jgi:hypothetical protein
MPDGQEPAVCERGTSLHVVLARSAIGGRLNELPAHSIGRRDVTTSGVTLRADVPGTASCTSHRY